jgi:hypothetical protein
MKIATVLDRPPSQYFKKWVTYHSTLFNKEDFIFINFRENNNELREYLENKGFSDITSLTITENRYGRFELFDEHLSRYLDAGISSNTTFILNCPLKNITNPDSSFYRNFVLDSTHIINRVKFKVLQHNHKFIFLDSDELIVCDDINALLDTNFTQIVPVGYTVIQTNKETRLDWDIPIYEQRSFWKRESYFYDKPIIVQEDINWGPGRHVHHHDPIPVNENITLFHLRDVCFNYLYNENLCTKAIYPDQPEDHRRNWEDKSEYDTWVEQRQLELTPIIDEVKVLLKKYNI